MKELLFLVLLAGVCYGSVDKVYFERFDTLFRGGCGDGLVQPGETCDDLNRFDGDGCDSNCQLEGDSVIQNQAYAYVYKAWAQASDEVVYTINYRVYAYASPIIMDYSALQRNSYGYAGLPSMEVAPPTNLKRNIAPGHGRSKSKSGSKGSSSSSSSGMCGDGHLDDDEECDIQTAGCVDCHVTEGYFCINYYVDDSLAKASPASGSALSGRATFICETLDNINKTYYIYPFPRAVPIDYAKAAFKAEWLAEHRHCWFPNPKYTCFDGNSKNGDGCSSDCQIERGWACDYRIDLSSTINVVSNTTRITDFREINLEGYGGCIRNEYLGYATTPRTGIAGFPGHGGPSKGHGKKGKSSRSHDHSHDHSNEDSNGKCGNGKIEGSEVCDDGNKIDGDGCSKTCQVEEGYICSEYVVYHFTMNKGVEEVKGNATRSYSKTSACTEEAVYRLYQQQKENNESKKFSVSVFGVASFLVVGIAMVTFQLYRNRKANPERQNIIYDIHSKYAL